MPNWLTADDITARLQAAALTPDNLCTFGTCPTATPGDAANGIAGRNPPYVRIHAPSSPATPRIGVLVSGGVHAREWAPPDALVEFVDTLLATHGTDPVQYPQFSQNTPVAARPLPPPSTTPIIYPAFTVDASAVQRIVQRIDLYIAPLINPDGREFSRKTSANMGWRKNRNGSAPACIDDRGLNQGIGVDLNRNFDIAWEYPTLYAPAFIPQIGTQTTTCPGVTPTDHEEGEVFRGSAKMQEPEVKNLDWLQQQSIQVFVDIHSTGPDIMYPWGIAKKMQSTDAGKNIRNPTLNGTRDANYAEYIPDTTRDRLLTVGGRMQHKIRDTQTLDSRLDLAKIPEQQRFTGEYVVQPSALMYPTTGACDDYHFNRQFQVGPSPSYSVTPTPPERLAFTVECGSDAQGQFWPDYTNEYPKIKREVHAALWGLLSWVSSPAFSAPVSWPTTP